MSPRFLLLFSMTSSPAMVTGLNGYQVTPAFTIGDEIDGYFPPGIPDGSGAFALDEDTVRFLVNHELTNSSGYAYSLDQGTPDPADDVSLPGARVSYFDINVNSLQLEGAGLAYNRIFNRAGALVESPADLEFGGINRLCSAQYFEAEQFGAGRGLADALFFTGEETDGGTEFVLDPATDTLYAVPWMGRAAWESVTELDTGTTDKVALLIGDDRGGAPLLLYVGEKGEGDGPQLLVDNGLAKGKLYVWSSENGDTTPEQFKGTGSERTGNWVEIDYYRPELAGNGDYDALGFATQAKQDSLAAAAGAFLFSRPEDVSTNPGDGTEAVMASTGRGSLYPSDNWGTTYIFDTEFGADGIPLTATARIVYDGDDAGNGQFGDPDEGLRSPDNLDWSEDGFIYIQEDRSTSPSSLFGATSGEEASIWKLDPESGALVRVGQVDRTAVPQGQTDADPDDLGDWETSGILDVSDLFGVDAGGLIFFDVQAHSLRGGTIDSENLVEGGQLGFLYDSQALDSLSFFQDGGNGMDLLTGGLGNDTLMGGNGKDELWGNFGDDVLDGGNGRDVLSGGLGNDTLTGGNGPDTFVLAAGEGSDLILDYSTNDRIGLAGGLTFADLTIGGVGDAEIYLGAELLATLSGVVPAALNAADFVSV